MDGEQNQNEVYDVGIYGLWYGMNYGSILTYFALHTVVTSLGYKVVMIRNPLGTNRDPADYPKESPIYFAGRHYELSQYYPLSEMRKLNGLCKIFLLGADQMWNYDLSREYGQTYFLDFADNRKIKITYGTSFGQYPYNGPDSEKKLICKNMARMDAVSVRDGFSKMLCEEEFSVKAQQVLDPVFLCETKEYEKLAETAERQEQEAYIFAYLLDPDQEMGQALKKIAEYKGRPVRIIFDLAEADKEVAWKRLALEASAQICYLESADVCTWLWYVKNADYVLTDSFHGACFSIIFQKKFAVLKNERRGGKRFADLLEPIGLAGQMANHTEDLILIYQNGKEWNYEEIARRLRPFQKESMKFLTYALQIKKTAVSYQLDMEHCTGCGACVSICPCDAMQLKPDDMGYYRSSVDMTRCVACGKCVSVCPVLHLPEKEHTERPECYAFIASDLSLLQNSSSGAVFPLLAREAFLENGYVAGASWTKDFFVEHILINTVQELRKLQKSKYLQSYMGTIFREIRKKLEAGEFVLFSGCPCQVAGLTSYLGRDYERLIKVDLLCGNAPSAQFFQKYLKDQFPQGVERYEFRHKVQGWNADCVTVTVTVTGGEPSVRRGGKQDVYQRAYHSHVMCAPHCEECRYQEVPRYGDLTIGDFWGISKYDASIHTEKGVSVVLCNSGKGKAFFEKIPEIEIGWKKQVPLAWLGRNGVAAKGSHNWCSPKRNTFYEAIRTMQFTQAVNYAWKPNHGIYREIYGKGTGLLVYDTNTLHFRYDERVWEEHCIMGKTVLIVKPGQSKKGNYAVLPLLNVLDYEKKYAFHIRFKIQSKTDVINFHIKDSGSDQFQVVESVPIKGRNKGNEWIEVNKTFSPDADFYDEFMIGALHVNGEQNFFMLDYIVIERVVI